MFEITVSPMWIIFLFVFFPVVVFLVSLSIELYVFEKMNKDRRGIGKISFASFVPSILLCVIVGFSGVFSTEYTGDNPVNAPGIEDTSRIAVKEFHLKEKISDAVSIESLKFEGFEDEMNPERSLFETLQKGDFVDFAGIKEDSKVNGSVYFTEDSMVVIIENESAVKDKIVVPAK